VFAHLQCGLEPRNLDGTNLGSCWCLKPASRFVQRDLSLPHAWKSILSVACWVFCFSLLWWTLLLCSGRTIVTATSLSFLKVFGLPTLFSLNYLANWYQESSQVWWRACHAWFIFGTLNVCLLLYFLVAFSRDRRYPSQLLTIWPTWMGVFGPLWVFWRCSLSGAIEACATRLGSHTFSVDLNPETSMALT